MFTPATLNLIMYQGATFDHTLTWTVDTLPVDLTDYTARLQARAAYTDVATVIDITDTTGITLSAAGVITITIDADATALVPAGTYRYDLELEDDTGVVTRLLMGRMNVSAEVTR
jgi:hypothetical protein